MKFEIRVQEKITLQFSLPKAYPTRANPVVTFTAPSLLKVDHRDIQAKLNDLLSSLATSSEERLLEIIDSFISYIPSKEQASTIAPSSNSIELTPTSSNCIVLIWFHHLLSTTKRKSILALQFLRGISKPGYPGILILQGPKDILNDAVRELKGMNWQAMQVRDEIEDHEQQLNEGIHEVETVAEVVERMEALGLGDWCLAALRMK